MINFTRDEYACNCGCGFDTVDYELDIVMDDIREYFNRPVHINRGASCVDHNEVIQKIANPNYIAFSSDSQHLYGKGCDFWVEFVHEDIVADYLEEKYPNKYGIGRYKGRTHIDVRKYKAGWDKRFS